MEYLRQKALEFADHIRLSTLEKNDVWLALTSVFMRIIEYPMAAITLTEQQWSKIMAPITIHVLPKSGLAMRFLHTVLYTPLKFQGRGLLHPYINNYVQQIHTLLYQTNRSTLMGDLISTKFENLWLEIEIPGSITDASYKLLDKATTDCWFKSIWKFAQQHNISIFDPLPQLAPQRANNECIMSKAMQHSSDPTILKLINDCRQFLRITYLSDIMSADGTMVLTNTFCLQPQFQAPLVSWYTWP